MGYTPNVSRTQIISIIANNIGAFSASKNREDIFKFFKKDILDKIIYKLPTDLMIIEFLNDLKSQNIVSNLSKKETIKQIMQQCENTPVKFWLTFKLIEKAISGNLFDSEDAENLMRIPNNIIKEEKELKAINDKKINEYVINDLISYRNSCT